MKPTLILVGADKGGVGKTTTARALLDFLSRSNILMQIVCSGSMEMPASWEIDKLIWY